MKDQSTFYRYQPDGVSFVSEEATNYRTIYAPLCGVDDSSLKSAITPFLSGDIKIDKNCYLTKPVSTEDLRMPLRQFFVRLTDGNILSLTEPHGKERSAVEVGQLWHKLTRVFPEAGIEMQALNFIPVDGSSVEIMKVSVKNVSDKPLTFTPTSSIPIFGRVLANKHDHEHVTSLLHRIEQNTNGVLVKPVMIFDEEGHKPNSQVYFVYGSTGAGESPDGSFPTVPSFYGTSGTPYVPEAVYQHLPLQKFSDDALNGREAVGALRFKEQTLKAGESVDYHVIMGVATDSSNAQKQFAKFNTATEVQSALEDTVAYWKAKSESIVVDTADKNFNAWMRWVTLQPVLRRIFGCSFLPDHDYGKGGKGWRDIWQDLLSLILIEPEQVRETLVGNFAGVRIDGSNATIIGSKPGEFIADRNAITRVWMDHGAWPLMTIRLYINQSGDYSILLEQQTYFRDLQISRTFKKDTEWSESDGSQLKASSGDVYQGSVLEHILVQNLVQFFNVGEHNLIRLESADWNDGLDMAFDRGESVTFSAAYAGNFKDLAQLLQDLSDKQNITTISLSKELLVLLDKIPNQSDVVYDSIDAKKDLLFKIYFPSVQPNLSGDKQDVAIVDIIADLKSKSEWLFSHIRNQEKVSLKHEGKDYTWFNGYYDNKGMRVEGKNNDRVWMTLTGQVFPVMSGLSTDDETRQVIQAVEQFLRDPKLRGYRLNSDFGLPHYLDMGRAFGFAFGTKENGAFFSHMIVMYAFALYKRGFAREGYTVLNSIFKMSTDTDRSRIYPGVPEYMDSEGRGMYHYLTGSASWFVLAELTQVFGVRGDAGDLILDPQLVREEFDEEGIARIQCQFAGRRVEVVYSNKELRDVGQYFVDSVSIDGQELTLQAYSGSGVCIARKAVEGLSDGVQIHANLL